MRSRGGESREGALHWTPDVVGGQSGVVLAQFPTTRWSLVVRARGRQAAHSRRALEELCHAYWPPLYGFLRTKGLPRDEAEEIVQGFFAAFLGRHGFEQADEDRGRLRTFLLASLNHYLANQREHDQAAKRGAFVTDSTATDVIDQEIRAGETLDAEQAYMRFWARRVLAATFDELRRDYANRDKQRVFEELAPFLVETPAPEVSEAVRERLGLTPGAAKVALHRLRARFGGRLRRQVAETVAEPGDIDAELRALIATMSNL